MSANLLNRFTPLPAISPTPPLDEKQMSSKVMRRSRSSDRYITGGAIVCGKPPMIKRKSFSIIARITSADGKEKKFSDTDAKTNCTHVEAQNIRDSEKKLTAAAAAATDAAEHELLQSEEGSAVRTNNASLGPRVNGNAPTAAATDDRLSDDDDDDGRDEQSNHVSVSFCFAFLSNTYDDISTVLFCSVLQPSSIYTRFGCITDDHSPVLAVLRCSQGFLQCLSLIHI